ncbi:hypothetical protein J2Y41_002218 [Arthrobacter sp. 1088]|uniref:hypothetical protein n=1 Tax=Arthrobacter sp. 1088 TaxID=2817768 RepID=UPI00285C2D30|nr:hypothetical protein [Arthrobacter sp. 1088]MDR6686657.1 hypothetical protein [Arthrobacter sp. 1088]
MKNKKALRLAPVAVLVAAMLYPAVPAAAALQLPISLPAGEGCSFALMLDGSGGIIHTTEFKDKDGNVVRVLEAGKGVLLTYTNLDTGESVTIRTDGSVASTRVNADGTLTVTATGHNGLILFPTDIPAGPTTTHYIGKLVYDIDPVTGVFTFVTSSGQQRDICEELE